MQSLAFLCSPTEYHNRRATNKHAIAQHSSTLSHSPLQQSEYPAPTHFPRTGETRHHSLPLRSISAFQHRCSEPCSEPCSLNGAVLRAIHSTMRPNASFVHDSHRPVRKLRFWTGILAGMRRLREVNEPETTRRTSEER